MKNTIKTSLETVKAIGVVMVAPVLFVTLFHVDVINVSEMSSVSRSPAVEKVKTKTKTLRDRLQTYAVAPTR